MLMPMPPLLSQFYTRGDTRLPPLLLMPIRFRPPRLPRHGAMRCRRFAFIIAATITPSLCRVISICRLLTLLDTPLRRCLFRSLHSLFYAVEDAAFSRCRFDAAGYAADESMAMLFRAIRQMLLIAPFCFSFTLLTF